MIGESTINDIIGGDEYNGKMIDLILKHRVAGTPTREELKKIGNGKYGVQQLRGMAEKLSAPPEDIKKASGLYTFNPFYSDEHANFVKGVQENGDVMGQIRDSLRIIIPEVVEEKLGAGAAPGGGESTARGKMVAAEAVIENFRYRHPIHIGGPQYGSVNKDSMENILHYNQAKAIEVIGCMNKKMSDCDHDPGKRDVFCRYGIIAWTPLNPQLQEYYNTLNGSGHWKVEQGVWFLHTWGINLGRNDGQTIDKRHCNPGGNGWSVHDTAETRVKYNELLGIMFQTIDLGIKSIGDNGKTPVVLRIPKLGLGEWAGPFKGNWDILRMYEKHVAKLSEDNHNATILFCAFEEDNTTFVYQKALSALASAKAAADEGEVSRLVGAGFTGKGETTPYPEEINQWNKDMMKFEDDSTGNGADPFGTFDAASNIQDLEFSKDTRWIIVNAWDDGSFIGNACSLDNTLDGWTVAGELASASRVDAEADLQVGEGLGKKPNLWGKLREVPGWHWADGSFFPSRVLNNNYTGIQQILGFQTQNASYLHNSIFHQNLKNKVVTKSQLVPATKGFQFKAPAPQPLPKPKSPSSPTHGRKKLPGPPLGKYPKLKYILYILGVIGAIVMIGLGVNKIKGGRRKSKSKRRYLAH